MSKYFAVLLSIAILMILATGGGTYWVATKEIEQSHQEAAAAIASGIGTRVNAHIDAINSVLDNMGRDPRIAAAIAAGDKTQLQSLIAQFEPLLTGIMKLRLLLPNENPANARDVPAMGFADIDLVRETFNADQPPMVQGEDANRHLAIARGIKIDQRVVAVLLASMKFDFLHTALLQEPLPFYIELQQDNVTLTAAGDIAWKQSAASTKLKVPQTQWQLQYWYPIDEALHNYSLFWIALILPLLITCLLFFIAYRRFIIILHGDQSNILRFLKDLLLDRPHSNYPVHLDELRVLLSSVMQFKRIKDAENIIPNTAHEDAETFALSSFFGNGDLDPEALFSDEPTRTNATDDIFDADADVDAASLIRQKIAAQKSERPVSMPAHTNPIDELLRADNNAGNSAQQGIAAQKVVRSATPPKPNNQAVDNALLASDADDLLMPEFSLFDNKIFMTTEKTGNIYRAYDIRGIVGETLTKEVIYDLGRALGSVAKETGNQDIVVGRDGRNSSQALCEALCRGIASTGLNILDIGLVPTPVLYFVAHHHRGQSGVMVTGSHNPSNYNGLKMVINGETLFGEKIQMLKKRIEQHDFAEGVPGSVTDGSLFINEYIGLASEEVHLARPMKIVVDCGNGAAGKLAPVLLKTLGCEVVEQFCDIDGNFPNHHPDPSKPENLADLIASVRHYEAELGLAFDGDGDRLGVVDSSGKIIWPDRQMMLFAKDVLAAKRGAEIIYDVKCSKHLAAQIKQYGGRPLMWKSGHSFMKAKLKETGAPLAGEMSGHIFFNDRWFGFDDALYAAARLIEILSADNRPSAEVFADFPDSVNTPELTIDLREDENFKFIEALIASAHFSDAEITTMDGLRADFSDGWGLVRASNTTPSLMMRFEADNARALNKIQSQFKQLMLQIKPDLQLPF